MLSSFVHESNRLRDETTSTLNRLGHEQSDFASSAKIHGVFKVLSVKLSRIAHASVWSSILIWERSCFNTLGSWYVVIPAAQACQLLGASTTMITVFKGYDWVVASMGSRKLSSQSIRF